MRSLVIIALTCLILVNSQSAGVDTSFAAFQKFVRTHGKAYASFDELKERYNIWTDNIKVMQTKLDKINATFEIGLNEFSDMTSQEFKKQFLTLDYKLNDILDAQAKTAYSFTGDPLNFVNNAIGLGNNTALPNLTANANSVSGSVSVNIANLNIPNLKSNYITIPSYLNYAQTGLVTPVKNQGTCGCCWSFATVATIEGQYYKKTGKTVSFSEQHLVNCDSQDLGCNGGFMTTALDYIKNNLGSLPTMASAPYLGYKSTCNRALKSDFTVTGYTTAGTTDELQIALFLYQKGPIAVALNANSYLQYYKSGILNLNSANCNPNGINHAVTIVGYGTQNGLDYWIVKNSWGTTWGEAGYFRIARGSGVCGINKYSILANIA